MDRGDKSKTKRAASPPSDPSDDSERRALGDARRRLDVARPVTNATPSPAATRADRQRRELADVCRVLMIHAAGQTPLLVDPARSPAPPATVPPPSNRPTDGPGSPDLTGLSPRVRQTLDRLLLGDSEKQIARHLLVSPHTVHVYVKSLYRKLKVNSRGELLARFVRPVEAGTNR